MPEASRLFAPPVGDALMPNSAPRPGSLELLRRIFFHTKAMKTSGAAVVVAATLSRTFVLPTPLLRSSRTDEESSSRCFSWRQVGLLRSSGKVYPAPSISSVYPGAGGSPAPRRPRPRPLLPRRPSPTVPHLLYLVAAPGFSRGHPDTPFGPWPSHPTPVPPGTSSGFAAFIIDHSAKT